MPSDRRRGEWRRAEAWLIHSGNTAHVFFLAEAVILLKAPNLDWASF